MNWVKYLKIKNFKVVISRDEIPTKVKNIPGQSFIINLDNTEGPGAHWVAVKITADYVNYFDSFGLQPPQELVTLCYAFNKLYKGCMKTLIHVLHQSYHFSDLLSQRTMLNEDL